jgi:hypothetical protein
MDTELAHLQKVNNRLKEREKWFETRIQQLDSHIRNIVSELQVITLKCKQLELENRDLKKKYEPKGESNLECLQLQLDHLPCEQESAKKFHTLLLEEEGIPIGMTPVAPLLPIPSHSIKKTISWSELPISSKENAFVKE